MEGTAKGEMRQVHRETKRRSSVQSLVLVLFFFMGFGCQSTSTQHSKVLPLETSFPRCDQIEKNIDLRDRIETLRDIAKAYYAGCDEIVITYGTKVQNDYRYKTFSILKETSNIFLPDGTLIDYVLESYERGFLTVLLAMSHYRAHNFEASKVELRRLDHEIFTSLYNHGADPVNLIFSAVLWEMLGEHHEAWVDWNRLASLENLDESTRNFVSHRLKFHGTGKENAGEWEIHAIGKFPTIDWNMKILDTANGYFSVKPQQNFPPGCSSESGMMISTDSWFQKIAMRHNSDYHPLLNAQSWLRLPVGFVYGVTTFTAGAGIAFGGCFLDAYAKLDGSLCRGSVEGGMKLMGASPDVLRLTIRPDLRHWDNVPSSFLLTTVRGNEIEPCLTDMLDQDQFKTIKIFGRPDGMYFLEDQATVEDEPLQEWQLIDSGPHF